MIGEDKDLVVVLLLVFVPTEEVDLPVFRKVFLGDVDDNSDKLGVADNQDVIPFLIFPFELLSALFDGLVVVDVASEQCSEVAKLSSTVHVLCGVQICNPDIRDSFHLTFSFYAWVEEAVGLLQQ